MSATATEGQTPRMGGWLKPMKRFFDNLVIDLIAAVFMIGMLATGYLLRFPLPPGSNKYLTLWGLTRHQWGNVHFWISLGLLAIILVHLCLHWQWVVVSVKRRLPCTNAAAMYADSIAPGTAEAEDRMMEQERAYLDEVVKRLATVSSVPVTAALLEGPVVAEMLQGHAATSGADLTVMTTHGRGPLSRFWLGSVADEMVRRATTPILLVRPHEKAVDLAAQPDVQDILVPFDGSALAEKVLEPAIALGSLMKSDYRLLRIYGPEIDLDLLTYSAVRGVESAAEQLRLKAQDYLNRVADRLKGQGFTVQAEVVRGDYPAISILDSAHRLGVDLIALETHGRRGIPRLLLGSVADKVIRAASIPVLIHRSLTGEGK